MRGCRGFIAVGFVDDVFFGRPLFLAVASPWGMIRWLRHSIIVSQSCHDSDDFISRLDPAFIVLIYFGK